MNWISGITYVTCYCCWNFFFMIPKWIGLCSLNATIFYELKWLYLQLKKKLIQNKHCWIGILIVSIISNVRQFNVFGIWSSLVCSRMIASKLQYLAYKIYSSSAMGRENIELEHIQTYIIVKIENIKSIRNW